MYKKVLILVAVSFFFTFSVYAHLTGAFADFLAIVYDESTIEQLQVEMEQTKAEIEALTPKVNTAEEVFEENQKVAVEQLQFYSEVGLDTWLGLMQQGNDVVDLMGNQWMMETKINDYLVDLNALYLEYQQLVISQQTLEGHAQLLEAIEKNLQSREAFLKETAGLELEVIANYLDIDWTSEVEEHIIADLQADADTVEANLLDWVEQSATLPYKLDEQWLNNQSNARYYFRNDHVYIEYEQEFAHVLVLGQILQNEEGTGAKLVIEAGFYNGFYLPEELLVELPSFELPYEPLKMLKGITNPYFIQTNGGLELYSK